MNRTDAIRLLRGEVVQLMQVIKDAVAVSEAGFAKSALAHAEMVLDITKTSEPPTATGPMEFQR